MSRSPSARLRGAATVVVLLAGTWPLRSQDRPGSPSTRNTAADTLEAARAGIRELEAGREARSTSGGSLPRLAAPEWHGGAAPAPPLARPVRPNPPADARNPNWLIDALQQSNAAGVPAQNREDARSGRPGGRIASERTPTGLGPSSAGMITNPLTTFLDDWMSPQDFALLNPGRSGRSSGMLPLPDLGLTTGGLTAGPPSPAGANRGADPTPPAPGGDRPGAGRENPFLAALNPPGASVTGAAQTPRLAVPAPGSAAVTTPSLQSPPSPPPAPRTPDFARPTADEKYFKPLKRF